MWGDRWAMINLLADGICLGLVPKVVPLVRDVSVATTVVLPRMLFFDNLKCTYRLSPLCLFHAAVKEGGRRDSVLESWVDV